MLRTARILAFAAMIGLAAPAIAVVDADALNLKSASVLVLDEATGQVLVGRNARAIVPIASITKLMTAMVTMDARLPLDEQLEITEEDYESVKGERVKARLPVGSVVSREDLLRLALMASDNRAAAALGRTYPGGPYAFVQAMNVKAQMLGMSDSHFVEPTGLMSANVSSAQDLAKLVRASNGYPLIRDFSTTPAHAFVINGRLVEYGNTNALVKDGDWEIGVQKTGFIREAGRCLVMYAKVAARPVIIVLLDSVGRYTRLADAARIRDWLDPDYDIPNSLAHAELLRERPVSVVRLKASGRMAKTKTAKLSVGKVAPTARLPGAKGATARTVPVRVGNPKVAAAKVPENRVSPVPGTRKQAAVRVKASFRARA
jgi:D-alanyl-D-alanine endopeptidase (penicillin-binding protein 7)